MTDQIRITIEDPRNPIPAQLITELSAELAVLYPDSHGGDGAGSFKPTDVLVPRATFLVIWNDNEPLGCGAIRPMDDPSVAEVKRMYVRKSARGHGYSRMILAKLEDMAREFGYTSLILETGVHQHEALGLYEKAGYSRIDCYDQYIHEPLSICFQKTL